MVANKQIFPISAQAFHPVNSPQVRQGEKQMRAQAQQRLNEHQFRRTPALLRFHRGELPSEGQLVPKGRLIIQTVSAVPSGLYPLITEVPTLKRWAIIDHPSGMMSCALVRSESIPQLLRPFRQTFQ